MACHRVHMQSLTEYAVAIDGSLKILRCSCRHPFSKTLQDAFAKTIAYVLEIIGNDVIFIKATRHTRTTRRLLDEDSVSKIEKIGLMNSDLGLCRPVAATRGIGLSRSLCMLYDAGPGGSAVARCHTECHQHACRAMRDGTCWKPALRMSSTTSKPAPPSMLLHMPTLWAAAFRAATFRWVN